MGYRDQTEALKARIVELESEVAKLREQLNSNAVKSEEQKLVAEIELDGEVGEETLADLVSTLRKRFSVLGQVQQIGGSLAWSTVANPQVPTARNIAVTVESRKGRTHIRVQEDLVQLRATYYGIAGGLGIPVGVAGIGMAIALKSVIAWLPLIGGAMAVWYAARRRYRQQKQAREAEMHALAEELRELVSAGATPAGVQVRIAPEVATAPKEERVGYSVKDDRLAEPETT